MRPSIEDVASRAGVSRQTVSRVINGQRSVAAGTHKRVLDAIRELGYRRNALASGLRSGRSQVLGLLISNILNPLFVGQVRGIQDVADAADYQVILGNTDEDVGKEERLLRMLREKQIDGALVIPCGQGSREALSQLVEEAIPVVLLNRSLPGFDSVTFDTFNYTQLAIQHLIDQGHQRIGILTATRPDVATQQPLERIRAYRETLKRNNLLDDPMLVATAGPDEQAGYDSTLRLLRLPQPPTAIFATRSWLTLGAVLAIKDLSLRMPDDVALVGCHEGRWSRVTDPPLTMVQTDPYALGHAAAELLLRRIRGDHKGVPTTIHVPVPATLDIRESSRSSIPRPRLRVAGRRGGS